MYCGDVWGGGGRGSRRCSSGIEPDLGFPCLKYSESLAKIRDAAFKFVSLRPESQQITP